MGPACETTHARIDPGFSGLTNGPRAVQIQDRFHDIFRGFVSEIGHGNDRATGHAFAAGCTGVFKTLFFLI